MTHKNLQLKLKILKKFNKMFKIPLFKKIRKKQQNKNYLFC